MSILIQPDRPARTVRVARPAPANQHHPAGPVRRVARAVWKWAGIAVAALLGAAPVALLVFMTPGPVALGLAAGWVALLALVVAGGTRLHSWRAVRVAGAGFLVLGAVAVFAVLWAAGSYFHLASLSRQLLAGNAGQAVAFVDVNLVPMDSERIVPQQTVLVRDGRIAAIGPVTTTALPLDAVRVDGYGKYLMPGLTDMHAHIVLNLDDPLLFVANGVTAVRNMASYAPAAAGLIPNLPYRSHADLRDKIARGELVGPTLYLEPGPIEDAASPFVRGQNWLTEQVAPLYHIVSTPEEAARQVELEHQAGFTSVKTYSYLRADEYGALAAAAQARGMQIIGHIPRSVPVADALAGGQTRTIEHLSGYVHPCGGLKIPAAEIPRYARLTAESGVWNVPTLIAFANVPPPDGRAAVAARPEVRYVSPLMREVWQGEYLPFDRICQESTPVRYPAENLALMQSIVRAFRDAGAGILLGSDAGAPYVAPGFAIHDELRLLVDAGLTPYQALQAGTYNAAAALGALDDMGTVAVGKRADLLLLDANPLVTVANVRQRSGVMARGHWFTEAELQGALEALAAAYR